MSAKIQPRQVDAALLRAWPLPDPVSVRNKEDRGRVLVIAGSPEVPGAALLAGEGALRAGAGKLQLAVAATVATSVALAVPEAKVLALPSLRAGGCRVTAQLERAAAEADAVLIGPGMDDTRSLRRLVASVASVARCTVVADAGAIAAFDALPAFSSVPVLTPHPGEMASLLRVDRDAVLREPGTTAARFARRAGAVVVLKSPETWIATPERALFLHRGGCPGLGTSGSGDVLAGIIAGLAARGSDSAQASVWGVYAHARAGDDLSLAQGTVGFLARELAARIPRWLDRLAMGKRAGEQQPHARPT